MKKNVLLWDLGNVVVRWSPDTILETLNYSSEVSDYLRDSLFGHRDWLDLDQGITTEEKVGERLVAESGLSPDQVRRCFDVVRETLVNIEQSVDLINELAAAGVPMYVLSNMSMANADYLRQREYFTHFLGVVISAEEKLNKPDRSLFERVLSRYELEPGRVMFIDDTLENIDTARETGMHGLWFKGSDNCYAQIRQFVGH